MMSLMGIMEIPDEKGGFVRMLTFDDRPSVQFPADRVSVMIDGKLYDWYGREVKIDARIEQIVEPFGAGSSHGGIADACETFLVQLKGGGMTLAKLLRDHEEPLFKLPWAKYMLTGGMLNYRSVLRANEKYRFDRLDTELTKTPVFRAYLSRCSLPDKEHICALANVRLVGGASSKPMTIFQERIGEPFGECLFCCFAESRDAILNLPPDKEPEHGYANYVIGEVTVSEDGHKMTALMSKNDGKVHRISTDVEVLSHFEKQSSLWWYYT